MKTFAKKIIKKSHFVLKKELDEFYSDLILIVRGFIPAVKKFLTSEPFFTIGVLIGVLIGLIFHIM